MITIKIYNGNVYVPTKCGSRFCDEHMENPSNHSLTEDFIKDLSDFKAPKFFIVRNPMEYFYSALRTEILSELNNYSDDHGYEKIKICFNKVLKKMYDHDGTNHYDMFLYRKINQHKKHLKFVKLEDLSSLVSIIMDKNCFLYNKNEYSHNELNYTLSNKFIYDILKNDYVDYYHSFMEEIEKEHEIYKTFDFFIPNHNNVEELCNRKIISLI